MLREMTSPEQTRERRDSPRYDVAIDLLYGTHGEFIASTAVEISEAGLAFRCIDDYEPGRELAFRALVETGDFSEGWITGTCEVVRAVDAKVAVKFVELSSKDDARLRSLLSSLGKNEFTTSVH
jgi:hypothetical protein